jgi:hypothetical protein
MKEIEILKMEITKFITSQMLQNENNGKQMMIRGLQLVISFSNVLKLKITNGNGSNDN